jgi:hypothetical protein
MLEDLLLDLWRLETALLVLKGFGYLLILLELSGALPSAERLLDRLRGSLSAYLAALLRRFRSRSPAERAREQEALDRSFGFNVHVVLSLPFFLLGIVLMFRVYEALERLTGVRDFEDSPILFPFIVLSIPFVGTAIMFGSMVIGGLILLLLAGALHALMRLLDRHPAGMVGGVGLLAAILADGLEFAFESG